MHVLQRERFDHINGQEQEGASTNMMTLIHARPKIKVCGSTSTNTRECHSALHVNPLPTALITTEITFWAFNRMNLSPGGCTKDNRSQWTMVM